MRNEINRGGKMKYFFRRRSLPKFPRVLLPRPPGGNSNLDVGTAITICFKADQPSPSFESMKPINTSDIFRATCRLSRSGNLEVITNMLYEIFSEGFRNANLKGKIAGTKIIEQKVWKIKSRIWFCFFLRRVRKRKSIHATVEISN